MKVNQDEKLMLMQELSELKQEHQELDLVIKQLASQINSNRFEITRLKKQKLKIKDAIMRIESNLIPNLHA